MRRKREHDEWHEFRVAGAAIATLLLILAISELTDTDTPAPPPADSAPDLSDRHEVAQTVSRSDPRAVPMPPSARRGGAHSDTSGGGKRIGEVRQPAVVGQVLQCIRWQESRNQYDAVNTSSGAAGAYQLMPEWSDDWATKYGYAEWSHLTADRWPNRVQDAVAAGLFAEWPGAWTTYGSCT